MHVGNQLGLVAVFHTNRYKVQVAEFGLAQLSGSMVTRMSINDQAEEGSFRSDVERRLGISNVGDLVQYLAHAHRIATGSALKALDAAWYGSNGGSLVMGGAAAPSTNPLRDDASAYIVHQATLALSGKETIPQQKVEAAPHCFDTGFFNIYRKWDSDAA